MGKIEVFVSHTGQDEGAKVFASHLSDAFENQGVEQFYDAWSLRGGDKWKEKIAQSVRNCKVFVCIISPTYFERYWCMHELDLACRERLVILPVYFDGALPDVDDTLFRETFFRLHREHSKSWVSETRVKQWLANVVNLQEHQGIFKDSVAKYAEVALKKKVVAAVLCKLGREAELEEHPTTALPTRSNEGGPELAALQRAHDKKMIERLICAGFSALLVVIVVVFVVYCDAQDCHSLGEGVERTLQYVRVPLILGVSVYILRVLMNYSCGEDAWCNNEMDENASVEVTGPEHIAETAMPITRRE